MIRLTRTTSREPKLGAIGSLFIFRTHFMYTDIHIITTYMLHLPSGMGSGDVAYDFGLDDAKKPIAKIDVYLSKIVLFTRSIYHFVEVVPPRFR